MPAREQDDFMPFRCECAREVATDEPGAARNGNFHCAKAISHMNIQGARALRATTATAGKHISGAQSSQTRRTGIVLIPPNMTFAACISVYTEITAPIGICQHLVGWPAGSGRLG